MNAVAVATLALTLLFTACQATGCPTSVDEARSQAFLDGLDESTVVGIARVQRFVDSPDDVARGYDLDVQMTFKGEAAGVSTFLRTERLPTIQNGDEVLLIAEVVEAPHLLVPGSCLPLQLAKAGP